MTTNITPIEKRIRERKRRKYHSIVYKNDYAVIICDSKKFGTKEILVDKEDAEMLGQYTWYINKSKSSNELFYALTNCGKKKMLMHRIILSPSSDKMIDHINHNGLDNRRCNLKICTNMINQRNRKVGKNSKSGVIGVNWHPDGYWMAKIKVNQKNISLGYFKDIQKAIKVRKNAEREYWNDK